MALLMGPRMTAVTPVSTNLTPLPAFQNRRFSSRPEKLNKFCQRNRTVWNCQVAAAQSCFCEAQRCGVRKTDYPLGSWGIYPSGNKPVTSRPASLTFGPLHPLIFQSSQQICLLKWQRPWDHTNLSSSPWRRKVDQETVGFTGGEGYY